MRDLPLMPVVPLRDAVVFPGQLVTLTVGRPRSLAAVSASAGTLALVPQVEGGEREPLPGDVSRIGTVAAIRDSMPASQGALRITVEGLDRVRIAAWVDFPHHLLARVEILEDEPDSAETARLAGQVLEQYRCFIAEARHGLPENLPADTGTAGRLADMVASRVRLDPADARGVLEAVHVAPRLLALNRLLLNLTEAHRLETRIDQRVRHRIEKTQREYYLREQMRAIQEELGAAADSRADPIRIRIEAADLPEEARERALSEAARLEAMPDGSPEASVIRSYLDWIVALPWRGATEDRLDLAAARAVLDDDHYGLDGVKERILEFLAVRTLTGHGRGPILCLTGPPGVGKTSLAASVARALGRRFVRVSLGGIRDEAEIRGHRRTYIGALPGRILQGMRRAGSANPVFLLDEMDKLGSDFRGDPSTALLEALDPEHNREFSDHYLELAYDLSQVLFITTANNPHTIPAPLLDRMEAIHLPGYTDEEKLVIGRRHLLPRQRERSGLGPDQLAVDDGALKSLIVNYTSEPGVRQLERWLAAICRKAARTVVEGGASPVLVGADDLHRLLGAPQVRHHCRADRDQVGVVNGLGWTARGGELMPVEVSAVPGTGRLILTGHMGEVMRESAQAALTFTRSRAPGLGLDSRFYERVDIHVHFSDGALPKDGPSAGVAMAVGMISALTGQPVRANLAVTGEITLRGGVLPVGGVKEKVLAALRAGVTSVLIPADNQAQLDEIDPELRARITAVPVGHLDQVLDLIFGVDTGQPAAG